MTTTLTEQIIGIDHAAASDGFKLFVWEKRLADPGPAAAGGTHAVLLVHGATYGGARPFDLQVPGKDYSLMDYLAARGLDVFTFDVRGYGRSEKPDDGFSVTSESAVGDIAAVIEFICRERGVDQVDVLGWSWGASTAALYASSHPDRVRRLVMYAGGPGGRAAANAIRPEDIEPWVVSTRQTVMNRIEQDVVLADAQEAFIAEVLRWDSRSPTGFRKAAAEGRSPRPVSEQLTVPTLLIFGERDNAYDAEKASRFFEKLATADKALCVVPDGGHFLFLQKNRMRLFTAVEMWFQY